MKKGVEMEDINKEKIHEHEEAEISALKDKRKVENCPEESFLHSKKLKGISATPSSDSKDDDDYISDEKKENVSPTIDVHSSEFKDFEFKDENFDLLMDVKTKYRALCYNLKMLPHDNVPEKIHRDLVRGMIIQITEIVDQIKALLFWFIIYYRILFSLIVVIYYQFGSKWFEPKEASDLRKEIKDVITSKIKNEDNGT